MRSRPFLGTFLLFLVRAIPGPVLLSAALAAIAVPAAAQRGRGGGEGDQGGAPPLRFQWVGPAPAGRVAAIAGIPGDTTTYYVGAASGGIWKTIDGARTFAPIFDAQPVQAIGALAVAPANPRIVWAGTGEAWAIRDSDVMGDGIYKSTDAGATWRHMGLAETGRIGRIIVHPTNPATLRCRCLTYHPWDAAAGEAAAVAAEALRHRRGRVPSADANRASRSPHRGIRTSSGPPATATP